MDTIPNLRDRRSLNLSTSSTASNASLPSEFLYTSTNEKHSPTSPTLPTFVTKADRTRRKACSKFVLAVEISVAVLGTILLGRIAFDSLLTRSTGTWAFHGDVTHIEEELVSDDGVRSGPSLVTFSDNYGHSRWTIQSPQNYSYPLRGRDAQAICRRVDLLQESASTGYRRRTMSYYSTDRSFLDIHEAENLGLIPLPNDQNTAKTCEKSLTFVLDDEDAAFGKTLLILWLSYGLAKQEGRAFFIDDTRWAYGKYTTYFAPPPSQGCDRPLPHHLLPCPHSAKHILVSSATLPWTFGPSFEQEFLDPKKNGIERSHRIYALLRRGYEDLFHLIGEHALYAASRIAKFRDEAEERDAAMGGMHIRRGDAHPFEQQFRQDYIPLEWYGAAARRVMRSGCPTSELRINNAVEDFRLNVEGKHSPLILATDDPELFSSQELEQSVSPFEISRAQELVLLATKSELDSTSPVESGRDVDSIYNKFVDENTGWEGGFFSALLFSLDDPRRRHYSGSTEDEGDDFPRRQGRSPRELVGKAYVLDIAVLGQSDTIICAISSATCRLLGVMMGFDALKEGRWINIDGNRDGKRVWTWDGRR